MATHRYNVPVEQDTATRYASDLNDQEFELIAPHVAQKDGSGKKRTVDIREILNAIFYRTRTGCQWRMLPSDFPAWSHVWYYYRTWRIAGAWDRINTILAARYAAKRIANPNQALRLSIARASKRPKWVAKRDLTRINSSKDASATS